MTDGQKQKIISKYVEETCNDFLTTWKDIVKVEYRSDSKNNGYIRIITALGFNIYFDVTGLDCGSICVMLCNRMSNITPKKQLRDREAIREVEQLFK